MAEPKPAPERTFESEGLTSAGLRLVKDAPTQPAKGSESLPASATTTRKDVVERLLDRIKRI